MMRARGARLRRTWHWYFLSIFVAVDASATRDRAMNHAPLCAFASDCGAIIAAACASMPRSQADSLPQTAVRVRRARNQRCSARCGYAQSPSSSISIERAAHQQSRFGRRRYGLGAICRTELAVQLFQMRLDGVHREVERGRDLVVLQTLGQQWQELA